MKILSVAAIALGVAHMGMAAVLAAYADVGVDAQINATVSVYIPVEGTSKLLQKGTPAQVLEKDGDNAEISLTLENGNSVETEIETKYLKFLPPKKDSFAGPREGPPIRKTAVFNIEQMQVHDPQDDLQGDDLAGLQEGIKVLVNGHSFAVPQIKVVVKTSKDFQSKNVFARAYFFDGASNLIQAIVSPSPVLHKIGSDFPGNTDPYVLPPTLSQNQRQSIYFPLPSKVPKGWKAVIAFGTNKGAVSAVYPDGMEKDFKFPERQLVEKTALDPYQDIADSDPVPASRPSDVQKSVVPPDNSGPPPVVSSDGHKIVSLDMRNDVPGLPVMTFYVRYPRGVSPKEKVDGVFAYATYLTQKKSLEAWVSRPSSVDLNFQFADEHRLAVVTWTTATMYSIGDSFTYSDGATADRDPDNSMEHCFRTWKIGMDQLCRDDHLPENGYLIYGFSRGAQWAHRIVMRCPERFLAIHIHINSSYTEPTLGASHCLWLVTTGELEHGSKAARIFYQKAEALNYPILLRIYPGRAHEVFPEEEVLGLKFFDYALELRDQELKAKKADKVAALAATPSAVPEDEALVLDDSLLEDFHKPPYYGDLLNGDVYRATQVALLPESQRVDIPTLDIAKTWGYFHP